MLDNTNLATKEIDPAIQRLPRSPPLSLNISLYLFLSTIITYTYTHTMLRLRQIKLEAFGGILRWQVCHKDATRRLPSHAAVARQDVLSCAMFSTVINFAPVEICVPRETSQKGKNESFSKVKVCRSWRIGCAVDDCLYRDILQMYVYLYALKLNTTLKAVGDVWCLFHEV